LRKLYEMRRRERIHKFQGLNVYVKNIEDHITEDKLRKEFEPYGKIVSLTIMTNEKRVSKGFGFVCYSTPEEAQRAIAEVGKNKLLPGCSKPLYVAIHEPREIRQQRFTNTRNRSQKMPPQQPMYSGQGSVYYPQSVPYQQTMVRPNNWPQNSGQMQMPGYVLPQQTGGRGGRGTGRGGRGGGGQRNREMNELSQQPVARQKDLLGEQLFNRIKEREPDLSSKITGMIIHSEDFSIESVVELISDDAKLDNIIKEAKNFIERQEEPQNEQLEGEEINE